MNKHDITFEEINEELTAELILAQAAANLEMAEAKASEESFVASLNIDIPFVEDSSMLSKQDMIAINTFMSLGEEFDNDILLMAANNLAMLGSDIRIRAAEAVRTDSIEGISGEDLSDCGEWLQVNQKGIRIRVKTCLRYMEGSGYDIDDLIQEASLSIFKSWNTYNPSMGLSRTEYCWYVLFSKMKELYRKVHAAKRDCSKFETLNAVTLAHAGLENISLHGTMTWTSSAGTGDVWAEDVQIATAMKADLNAALATLPDEGQTVLSLLMNGYTQTEIAGFLGCSQSSVSCKVSAERKNLKAAMIA